MSLKLPQAYKSKIKGDITKITSKGQGKIVEWSGQQLLSNILYTYLVKKYKSECYINKLYAFILKKKHMYYLEETQNNSNIQKCCDDVYECSQRITSDIILIPLTIQYPTSTTTDLVNITGNAKGAFSGHANLLIFRKQKGILEHFEPHGIFIDEQIAFKIELFLKNFKKKLNEKFKKNIKFVESNIICPYGFQVIEGFSKLPIKTKGFCLVWTLFFAELVLKNPTLTSKQIASLILDEVYSSKDGISTDNGKTFWGDYFRNLITGYTLMLDEKIVKYLSHYDKDISISKLLEIIENINDKNNTLIYNKILNDLNLFIMNESIPNIKNNDDNNIKLFENISPLSKTLSNKNTLKLNITKKNKITKKEKAEAEKAEAEKERAEKERVEKEKAEKERAEAEAEKAEKERAEAEAEKEKAEKEKAEKEKAEKEKKIQKNKKEKVETKIKRVSNEIINNELKSKCEEQEKIKAQKVCEEQSKITAQKVCEEQIKIKTQKEIEEQIKRCPKGTRKNKLSGKCEKFII